MEEGVVKYQAYRKGCHELNETDIVEINRCRQYFYENNWIGQDANQIGFGNISQRYNDGFMISATQTGGYPHLSTKDYAVVTHWSIAENSLSFLGEQTPSSEALSHAALYANPSINAVVHFHDSRFWEQSIWKLPTTSPHIPYGTPKMGQALKDLTQNSTSIGTIIMAGHQDGVIIFAHSFDKIIKKMCHSK